MKVMMLATRAATPATMRTAFTKRSPVPRGSVSVAARCRRVVPSPMVEENEEDGGRGLARRRRGR